MKRFCLTMPAVSMALVIILAGCASQTPTTPPLSAPTAASSSNAPASGNVTASALVVPAQTSQMGYLISATVRDVMVKEGDKIQEGQTLMVLNTPDLALSVTGAEASARAAQAEAELQRYARKTINQAGRVVSLSGPPELRQIADAKVLQAQAALEIAQAALAQGTLAAPFNGIVVAINIKPGEFVQPGQVVMVLGNLDDLQIETTDLSERDIANVQVGQAATVRLKAFAQDFNGKVVAIAPRGEKAGGDVVYKVTIRLDDPPAGLMWGMSADVEIATGK